MRRRMGETPAPPERVFHDGAGKGAAVMGV